MKRKRRKEVELYVPKGYTFEELYDGDDTGYGFEEESPALQEEVKIRYERNDGKERIAGFINAVLLLSVRDDFIAESEDVAILVCHFLKVLFAEFQN